jgi:tRNA 2-thiouridine synthesizing protein E
MNASAQTAKYQTDSEGYLVDPSDWNETVAQELADKYGIKLGPDHWQVIYFMREYFEEHHVAVDARFVIKFLAEKHGGSGRDRLYKLFPYGYMQQACKIAGMRRPRAWSSG